MIKPFPKDRFLNEGKVSRAILGIVAVLFIAVIIAYVAGYRIGNFGIGKAQSVSIKNLPEETQIFLDNKSIGFKEGDVNLLLSPGVHSIIFSKSGFWPYIENLEISKDDKRPVSIQPFFFLQNPSGVLIGSNDPEYAKIISLFNKKSLPSENAPLVSASENVQIYIDDGNLFSKWVGKAEERPAFYDEDTGTALIFNPVTAVRSLAFYKDREDVLLLSMQDGIFALEIDPAGTQNLQPIFEGKEPDFRIDAEGLLYARDDKSLMLLNI